MFTGLLATARELRFPLTIGYAALLTIWLLVGEALTAAAREDALGRRLLTALGSIGVAAELGLYTFVAAMLGSILWNGGVARLVRSIAVLNGHPNWREYIDEAREAARKYGEYIVVTTKGEPGGKPSSFDSKHTVPSPEWGAYLGERVRERERKAAEMSFRVTLAVALIPIALALGIRGGGLWWLSLLAIPVVWLDVVLLKHTTLRVVNRYKLEDLQEHLRSVEEAKKGAQARLNSVKKGKPLDVAALERERARGAELQEREKALRAEIDKIGAQASRRTSKIFALIGGQSEE